MLVGFGSGVAAPMLAVLRNSVPAATFVSTRASTVKVRVSPTARPARRQVNGSGPPVCGGTADTKATPDGSGSVITTSVAAEGPALRATSV